MDRQHIDDVFLRHATHVTHRSGGREGFLVFATILGLGFLANTWAGTLASTWAWVFVAFVALGASYAMTRWVSGITARARARTEAEYREERENETKRQLAEMRARQFGRRRGAK